MAHDPKGMGEVQQQGLLYHSVHLAESPLAAVHDAEALFIATEWPDYAKVDMTEVHAAMLSPVVFDGRNLLDPAVMIARGFWYHGLGRVIPPA